MHGRCTSRTRSRASSARKIAGPSLLANQRPRTKHLAYSGGIFRFLQGKAPPRDPTLLPSVTYIPPSTRGRRHKIDEHTTHRYHTHQAYHQQRNERRNERSEVEAVERNGRWGKNQTKKKEAEKQKSTMLSVRVLGVRDVPCPPPGVRSKPSSSSSVLWTVQVNHGAQQHRTHFVAAPVEKKNDEVGHFCLLFERFACCGVAST